MGDCCVRIPSGKVDQKIYFVAFDATDKVTRETGLSSFTVYRSRNGGVAAVYTTPTVAELSAANMPGVYSLLIDEDTVIAAGSDSEEYCVHITHAGMVPVTRAIEIYRDVAEVAFDRAAGVETGLTLRQYLRLTASVLLGKASGLGTDTGIFRDTGDTKDRITATIDADGNRSVIVRDST